MELHDYLQVIRTYWRSTLAVLLLGVVFAGALSLLQKPTYTASSSVFLAVESGGTAGELSQGVTYAERQVKSYVAVATSAKVLQPVIDQMGLQMTTPQLANHLTVSSPSATSVIVIKAQSGDAETAAALSNNVAESLQNAVEELSPQGPKDTQLVSATIIDSALVPQAPSSPRPLVNLALGGVLGALVGFGQALLRSVLDTRVRTSDDLEEVTSTPLLASVGHLEAPAERAASLEGAQWATAEAYRRLRTNVGFVKLGGERRPSMVVTSSVGSEGKTQTAVNLARVLAEAGESVLLVDADLRRPQVAARMRLDSELGLSDVLTGRGSLNELKIEVIPGFLSVLPAGTVPPNPSELLGSEAMAHLLATAEREYDYVLFDSPPVLPVTDAVVLASQAGGAIVVSRANRVKKPQLASAFQLLDKGGVRVLGMVLNDVPITKHGTYEGYYSSYRSIPTQDPSVPVSSSNKGPIVAS